MSDHGVMCDVVRKDGDRGSGMGRESCGDNAGTVRRVQSAERGRKGGAGVRGEIRKAQNTEIRNRHGVKHGEKNRTIETSNSDVICKRCREDQHTQHITHNSNDSNRKQKQKGKDPGRRPGGRGKRE